MTQLAAQVMSHVAHIGRTAEGSNPDLADAYEGLASTLKDIMDTCGFDYAHPANPGNARALAVAVQGLAQPDSYMVHGYGPMNPFSLVFADVFNMPFQFANWGQAFWGIAGLYGTMPNDDAVLLTRTFGELAHLAASHPNNGGMTATIFNHMTLKAEDDALLLYLFRTMLDVEQLVSKHGGYVLTHIQLERAIFLFSVRRWRILRPQFDQAKIRSLETFVRELTSPQGPHPRRLCI